MKKYILILSVLFFISLVNAGLCYQETANASNPNDGYCNNYLNYSGVYSYSANWENVTSIYDGSFSTNSRSLSIQNAYIYINYTKPILYGNITNGSQWRIKAFSVSGTEYNITIPYACWNYSTNNINLLVESLDNPSTRSNWYCRNSSGWYLLYYMGGNRIVYEEGIYWNIPDLIENNQTYNPITYETTLETFTLNLNYDTNHYTSSSATLNYNGTNYTSTRSGSSYNQIFTSQIEMSQPIGNKSFYWIIGLTNSSGTFYYNSTFKNQTVNPITFGLCNSTINKTYLNVTFQDETTGLSMNSTVDLATFYYYLGDISNTKTYLFTNTSANPSYAFCFYPTHLSVNMTIEYFQYSNTGYPQRQYYFNGLLTNVTTNKLLYLLGSSYGIYSTFITSTQSNSPISGVTLQIERQFSGVWTLIYQGSTDSAGSSTVWLNPNYQHRVTAFKTGYPTQQVTISPSQSLYTIIMGGSTGLNYTSDLEGILYSFSPSVGILSNGVHTFGFNISASKNNLVSCKMELLDNNSNILTSTSGCTSSGGYISLNFDSTNYRKIYGRYSIDLGNGYLVIDSDAYWIKVPTNKTSTTIIDFLGSLRQIELNNFGNDENHREFTLIVLTFLGIMLVASVLSKMGWDFQTNGGIVLLVWLLILVASAGGFLTLSGITFDQLPGHEFIDKYFVAIVFSLFGGGYLFRNLI